MILLIHIKVSCYWHLVANPLILRPTPLPPLVAQYFSTVITSPSKDIYIISPSTPPPLPSLD